MFVARYPGRCANTGAPIRPGDTVRSVARGRYALVARAAAFFAMTPPAFAALPPLSASKSVLGAALLTASGAAANPIAALCSSTTVGEDDVFVCF